MKTLVLSMISIAATVAAMTACTSESDPVNEVDPIVNAKAPIEFTSSITGVQTKAIIDGDKFTASDNIGVYGYTKEAPTTTSFLDNQFLDNKNFEFDGTTFKATEAYWVRNEKHYFYAYYPVATTTPDPTTGYQLTEATADAAPSVKVVCKDNVGISEDLLWAEPATNKDGFTFTGVTASNVSLEFAHKLSQLKFVVKLKDKNVPASNLTNLSFKVNKNGGSLNLITGKLTETDGDVNFTKSMSETNITAEGIEAGTSLILPGSTISDLKVTINEEELAVNLTTPPTFEEGKITTVTITVKPYDVTMESSITKWGEGGSAGAGEV